MTKSLKVNYYKTSNFCSHHLVWAKVCCPITHAEISRKKNQTANSLCINTLTWLIGFHDELLYLVLFSLCRSLFWELRPYKIYTFNPKAPKPCSSNNISNVAYWKLLKEMVYNFYAGLYQKSELIYIK